jgi:cytochrome b
MAGPEPGPAHREEVTVWDPFVRLFHWSLVLGFTIAWVSAEEWDALHEGAGYVVMGLVALRLVWGLIGSRHARFSDFVFRPGVVIAYLKDMARFRARRTLGHNPAAGAMVIALLAALVVVSITGVMATTDAFWGVEWVEELHEGAASLTLGLVAFHLLGVVVSSLEQGENLVRAMITGRKRKQP